MTINAPAIEYASPTPTITTNKEKALWLLEKVIPGTGANNLSVVIQADAALDRDAVKAALAVVLHRHEILRTVFHADGADFVKSVLSGSEIELELERLTFPDDAEPDLTDFINRPFPFDGSPLLRIGLGAHAGGDVLCLAVHHLVFDMASTAVFLNDFIAAYDAIVTGRALPDEVTRPAPTHAEPEPSAEDLAYWRSSLAGINAGDFDLWCGLPRGRKPMMTGDNVTGTLSEAAQQALGTLQREVRAPLAPVLLAAYCALLAAHGAGPDIVVGSPVDVRATKPSIIGYHVNVLPLRVTVDFKAGFRELAKKARDVFLGAIRHANVSVDDLVAELPGFGARWQSALFQHMFNFLPGADVGDISIGGLPARLLAVESPYSKADMELVGTPAKAEICFRYSHEVLAHDDVAAMLRRFDALLVAAAKDPDRPVGEFAGWSELDRAVLDDAVTPQGFPSVVESIDGWIRDTPDAQALAVGERVLSYRQLGAAETALCGELPSDIGVGDVVAVAASATESVIAALATWRRGATLLPLDVSHDIARVRALLEQSGARALLTGTGADLSEAGISLPQIRIPTTADENSPVAVSGRLSPETGAVLSCPSGTGEELAAISQAELAATVDHVAKTVGAGPAMGTLTFAAADSLGRLVDSLVPLCTGGRLVEAPECGTDGALVREAIHQHEVRIVRLPAKVPMRLLEAAVDELPKLRVIVPRGRLTTWLTEWLLAGDCALYCAMGSIGWPLSDQIGEAEVLNRLPVPPGLSLGVLAPDGRELPIGLRGELSITGTAGRLRTGDIARWCADRSVQWLGSPEDQLFAEQGAAGPTMVEAVLLDHRDVRAAAAVVVEADGEDPAIVAFVETNGNAGAEQLGEHIGRYIGPSATVHHVVVVQELPRTPQRSVDLDALRERAPEALNQQEAGEEDTLIADLVELWHTLINVEANPQTNFFEAGGHSLLAAVLVQRVEDMTGVYVELAEVFEHPTPVALAQRVRSSK